MSAPDTDYLGLLGVLADHGLTVPVLSDEEIDRMADTLVRLTDETELMWPPDVSALWSRRRV